MQLMDFQLLHQHATSGSITFDSYNIKLDMTGIGTVNDDRSNDVGFPKCILKSN